VAGDISTQPKQGRQPWPMSSQSMYSLMSMVIDKAKNQKTGVFGIDGTNLLMY